ncbi:WD40_repeat protein [Hexamita inflata]|uniref:WD40 repeat protein n=1 Tax=Hexamita inflata TaxID=28002 RepID=A0AA86RGF0_9EUKA|nr:WD40 repeat protein [Hexamita inflata]CAI9972873.1 WD40 repeat protein [Hexamita inflata]
MFATKDTITSISFNQDSSCFIAGRVDGFSIYHTDPFRELYRRTFQDGFGVKVCSMLYRTSLIAFSGDTTDNLKKYVQQCATYQAQNAKTDAPKSKFQHLHSPAFVPFDAQENQFQPNVVYIYDDAVGKILGRLRFRSEVFSIKMRKDCICVSLANQIYVHSLSDLTLLDVINTADFAPPFGLSTTEDDFIVAYVAPGMPGRVGLNFYLFSDSDQQENEIVRRYIDVHKSNITALSLSENGQILVTGSEQGKQIRVFQTVTQTPICCWKRGNDPAVITGISLNKNLDFAVVCSTKGTVHVFEIPQFQEYQLKRVRDMLEGEDVKTREYRAFCKFKITESNLQTCAAFSQNLNTFVILTEANEYWKVAYAGERGADPSLRAKWMLI